MGGASRQRSALARKAGKHAEQSRVHWPRLEQAGRRMLQLGTSELADVRSWLQPGKSTGVTRVPLNELQPQLRESGLRVNLLQGMHTVEIQDGPRPTGCALWATPRVPSAAKASMPMRTC